jgi:hypothetical protein
MFGSGAGLPNCRCRYVERPNATNTRPPSFAWGIRSGATCRFSGSQSAVQSR